MGVLHILSWPFFAGCWVAWVAWWRDSTHSLSDKLGRHLAAASLLPIVHASRLWRIVKMLIGRIIKMAISPSESLPFGHMCEEHCIHGEGGRTTDRTTEVAQPSTHRCTYQQITVSWHCLPWYLEKNYYILRPLPQVLSSTFQKNYYIPRMLSQVLVLEVQSRSIVHLENGPPRSNLRKITSSMCFQKFNPEVFLLRRLVSKDRKKLKVQTLHPNTQVQCKEQPVRSYYLSIWVEPLSQHLDNREIWHWQKLWLEFGGEIADYTVNCRIVHCCCYALISAWYKKL